jgi:hypothetical protein
MIDPNSYELNKEDYGVRLEFNDAENFEDTNSAAQEFVDYAQEHLNPTGLAEKAVEVIMGDLPIKRQEDEVILPEREIDEIRTTLNEFYFSTAGDVNYT